MEGRLQSVLEHADAPKADRDRLGIQKEEVVLAVMDLLVESHLLKVPRSQAINQLSKAPSPGFLESALVSKFLYMYVLLQLS